jgi:hypothetical protein
MKRTAMASGLCNSPILGHEMLTHLHVPKGAIYMAYRGEIIGAIVNIGLEPEPSKPELKIGDWPWK